MLCRLRALSLALQRFARFATCAPQSLWALLLTPLHMSSVEFLGNHHVAASLWMASAACPSSSTLCCQFFLCPLQELDEFHQACFGRNEHVVLCGPVSV